MRRRARLTQNEVDAIRAATWLICFLIACCVVGIVVAQGQRADVDRLRVAGPTRSWP